MKKAFHLLLLALSISLFSGVAQGKILEGDWESAGAPRPPYDAPYDYAYACHAQITDELPRQEVKAGRVVDYRLHAVAKFEITKGKHFFRSDKLTWIWVKEIGEEGEEGEEEVVSQPVLPFDLRGHSISFNLFQGFGKKPDQTFLAVTVELPLGNYAVTELGTSLYYRDDEEIFARTEAHARRSRGANPQLKEYVSRKLFVRCQKKL